VASVGAPASRELAPALAGRPPEPGPESRRRDSFYGWWVVAVLTLILVFSFLDRSILALLVEPIKADLGISDTRMSLLLGPAFAAFYAVLGLPFGILADSWNRVRLIALGLLFWNFATAAAGLARSFGLLFLTRMGVGIGEATLGPAAPSIIADTVPRERLSTAVSVYSTGAYIGAGVATVLGGSIAGLALGRGDLTLPVVGAVRPWQLVFLVIGALGLVPLAILVATVREPPRAGVTARAVLGAEVKPAEGMVTTIPGAQQPPPLSEVVAHYRSNRRAIVLHHVAFTLGAFASYGNGSWLPSFMIRTHGWSIQKIGLLLGINGAIASTAGILLGGVLADRWYRAGKTDANLRVALLGSVLSFAPATAYPLVSSGTAAFLLLVATGLTGTLGVGCALAALQELMPNRIRGRAVAFYAVIANLIGLGLGPITVALLTDYVFGDESMLRYSILAVGVSCHLVSGIVLALALRPFRETVARVAAGENPA
jgi:MFS family permease